MTTASEEAQRSSEPNLRGQLELAVSLDAKQDQVVWAIFGIFWAANAVLIVALFTTGKLPDRIVGFVVSAVGAALSVLWSLVQYRAIGFLWFYEGITHKLEERLLGPQVDFAVSGKLNKALFDETVRGIGTRKLVMGSTIASSILWAAAAGWFFCGG